MARAATTERGEARASTRLSCRASVSVAQMLMWVKSDDVVVIRHVFDIWLNLTMARKIGLTIPDTVFRRATEVIP